MKYYNVALLIITLIVSACGSKMNGKYTDKNETIILDFKSSEKLEITTFGMTIEQKYSRDGNSIKIGSVDGQNIILKIGDDGCIKYPMVGNLCKKP